MMKRASLLVTDFMLFVILVIADQLTKHLAVVRLKNQAAYNLINGILEFNYLENRGAAFGVLQNQKYFFVFVALIFIGVIVFVLIKVPTQKKYYSLNILLVMIAAGAVGNMIDRVRYDYVVDFIYLVCIQFPIFNVADIYVTTATVILVFQILFVYKTNDFNFLSFNPKKFREL
ncbi:MAG TPA: signal peptidase II [Lachnospiraceae bacterium]|jgi:signal peptidase II|nr:MAG: signal peptidase II [Lachnospiraceae bacterium]HCG86446.1 signal peptidase II [Lachnospiraceae bacterium]HCH98573.1 signal peptidase II [Lachnospiraceae bacterium]